MQDSHSGLSFVLNKGTDKNVYSTFLGECFPWENIASVSQRLYGGKDMVIIIKLRMRARPGASLASW